MAARSELSGSTETTGPRPHPRLWPFALSGKTPHATLPPCPPENREHDRVGVHTDNWRRLAAVSRRPASDRQARRQAHRVRRHPRAVLHPGHGLRPGISLQSNPRALRRYCEKMGLAVSQIDGSYPMMGPTARPSACNTSSSRSASPPRSAARWSIRSTAPSRSRASRKEEVFRITCDNYRQVPPLGRRLRDHHQHRAPRPLHDRRRLHGTPVRVLRFGNLRFNMDTGNTFMPGLDPLEYLKRIRKYLTHAHIKDVSAGPGGGRPGRGDGHRAPARCPSAAA